jgi:hypothetical protein
MMLHRHFEAEKDYKNMTKLADVTPHEEEKFVSEVFPPDEGAPKRRGRPKKTEE